MKVVIIVLIFVQLVFMNNSSRNGGSHKIQPNFKFSQTGYKLITHIVEIQSFNETILSRANAVSFPYNRTIRAINVTFTMKVSVKDLKVYVQVYKFLSNEYRYFPVTIEFDFWDALQQDFFDFASFAKSGNVPRKADGFKKGQTYHLCNWIPDSTKFPPLMPTGDYKDDIRFMVHHSTALVVFWYGTIKEVSDDHMP